MDMSPTNLVYDTYLPEYLYGSAYHHHRSMIRSGHQGFPFRLFITKKRSKS